MGIVKIGILPDIKDIKYGAILKKNGVLFSIFSRNASKAWIVLFKDKNGKSPDYVFELNKKTNRIGDVWYVFIEGISEGWHYLWKMDGVFNPESGLLFNKDALLLDPYAKAITGIIESYPEDKNNKSQKYFSEPDNMAKCIVCSNNFDWEDDKPLNIPLKNTIIYETNLRGLTIHKSSGVKSPGTYGGLIEKIPYFKELGITAIELLPINEFSLYNDNRKKPNSNEVLNNYWGYNTLGFFAPNGRYASMAGKQIVEFKQMVKELHKAGLELIIDIVFNHSVEGDKSDKILSFKGIDNNIYYMTDTKTGDYLDYTGCGNTFNANHPIVSDFILDCLHYWVLEMHVDGFRFDLASALNRDEKGNLLDYSPLIKRIEESPLLRDTKIIAEAWDAGGGYQVGGFKGRWAEWNGKYRDDIRKFWRGDDGSLGNFATRITGSSDLFSNGRKPQQSINFIFSHDGYTMWDWLSYNKKHNLENGHNNEDGDNNNFNFNHGVEGETTDHKINQLRIKQAKNLLTTLFLSLGTPMINGGDEFLRTQKGNNNPYCQDNEISWFNWEFIEKNREIFGFFKEIIKLRKSLSSFFDRNFYKEHKDKKDIDIIWFGPEKNPPDWKGKNLAIGVLLKNIEQQKIIILFNSNNINVSFDLPIGKNIWQKIIDTNMIQSSKMKTGKKKKIIIKEKSIIVLKILGGNDGDKQTKA